MSITLNTKAYAFDTNPTPDSASYVGPANTASAKDILVLKRVKAKPAGTFPGMVRSTTKFVRTVTVGGVPMEAYFEGTLSYPAGTTNADIDALRDDAGDLWVSANGGNLAKSHQIVQ